MALGLVLRVVWISLLLDSSVLIEAQGNTFRQTYAKLNLVDVNDFSNSLDLDEGQGEPVSDRLSKVVNKEYKKSPVAQPLKLSSVNQNAVAPPANVGRLVNGAFRKWESNVFEPITFPLKTSSQMVDQTKPVYESQSEPPAVHGSRKPDYPSIDEITTGIQIETPKPVHFPNLDVSQPPSFESWQPVFNEVDEPVAGYFNQPQVYSTNAAGPAFPDPEPFNYQESNMVDFSPDNYAPQRQPSRKPQPAIPKYQSESWHTPEWSGHNNEIGSSFNFAIPNWLGYPFTGGWFPNQYVSRGYQPEPSLSYSNYLTPRGIGPFQKAPEPPSRKSFIVHSKNGYQRRRLLNTKTTYTPDYKLPKGKYGKSVKVLRGAAQNQIRSR